MAKSHFRFFVGERVFVPGEQGIQGLIEGRAESLTAEKNYQVAWLTADSEKRDVNFSEDDVIAAQPRIAERAVSDVIAEASGGKTKKKINKR